MTDCFITEHFRHDGEQHSASRARLVQRGRMVKCCISLFVCLFVTLGSRFKAQIVQLSITKMK